MRDTPYDPSEVYNEWSTGENDRALYERESLKMRGVTISKFTNTLIVLFAELYLSDAGNSFRMI